MESFVNIEDTMYSVSNLGNIRNNIKNKLLKPKKSSSGYLYVDLWINGTPNQITVHRLVAEYFCSKAVDHNEVNHIDEDKTNNKASNLEWCTHLQNMRHGTVLQRKACNKQRRVCQFTKEGKFIKQFNSCKEAEKTFDKKSSNISNCCRGKLKTAYGYIWRYSEEKQSDD